MTTLRWAIVYLVENPESQAKIHRELDEFYGADPTVPVKMEDRMNLPYTQGAVNEIQRLGNIVPMNVQHTSTRELDVGPWRLKAGTVLIAQVKSLDSLKHRTVHGLVQMKMSTIANCPQNNR